MYIYKKRQKEKEKKIIFRKENKQKIKNIYLLIHPFSTVWSTT